MVRAKKRIFTENPKKSGFPDKDSREKLEADIWRTLKWGHLTEDMVFRWLDRQKAITDNEWLRMCDRITDLEELRDRAEAERDELQAQLEATTARLVDVECANERLISENGKLLGQLERRALPDGIEWPRYADGAPVEFGRYHTAVIESIEFMPDAVAVHTSRETRKLEYGARVQRPPLLAKDGKPIAVGETLYGEDGRAWKVKGIRHGSNHPVQGTGDGGLRRDLKAGWLTHEKPDSMERVIADLRRMADCLPDGNWQATAHGIAERIESLVTSAREKRTRDGRGEAEGADSRGPAEAQVTAAAWRNGSPAAGKEQVILHHRGTPQALGYHEACRPER